MPFLIGTYCRIDPLSPEISRCPKKNADWTFLPSYFRNVYNLNSSWLRAMFVPKKHFWGKWFKCKMKNLIKTGDWNIVCSRKRGLKLGWKEDLPGFCVGWSLQFFEKEPRKPSGFGDRAKGFLKIWWEIYAPWRNFERVISDDQVSLGLQVAW